MKLTMNFFMLFTMLHLALADDPVDPAVPAAATTTTGPTTGTTPLTTTTTPVAAAPAAATTTTPTTTPAAGAAATTTTTPTTGVTTGVTTRTTPTTTGTTTGATTGVTTGTTRTTTGVTTGVTTGTTTGATNTLPTTTTTDPNAGRPPPQVVTNSDGSLSTIPATTVWVTLTVNGQVTTAMSLYSQIFSSLYSEAEEPSSGSVGMGSFTGEVGEVRDYETVTLSGNAAAGGLYVARGAQGAMAGCGMIGALILALV